MLCDFLMIGDQLHYLRVKNKKKTDIIYENCISCENEGKAVARFYINIKDEENTTELTDEDAKEITLLNRRNILAVKVKIIHEERKHWINYGKRLCRYLTNISNRKFKFLENEQEITIYDETLNDVALKIVKEKL